MARTPSLSDSDAVVQLMAAARCSDEMRLDGMRRTRCVEVELLPLKLGYINT